MQFFMGTDWVSFVFFFFFFIPLYIISKGLLLSESLPSNLLETGVGRKEKGANYWGGNPDQHFTSLASLIPKHTTSRYTTVQMYWWKQYGRNTVHHQKIWSRYAKETLENYPSAFLSSMKHNTDHLPLLPSWDLTFAPQNNMFPFTYSLNPSFVIVDL